MYEREQDMMKNESNNTAASEPKQPESTVTNQNPYSTSAATGSTTANHTAETNRTASGTTYGAANRYGSTTPTGYGYTTIVVPTRAQDILEILPPIHNPSSRVTATSIIIPIRMHQYRHPAAANRRRKRITSG